MTRSLPLILCAVFAAQVACADDVPPPADTPTPPAQLTPAQQHAIAALRAACSADIQKLCAGVQPGGGRIMACLKQHKDEVSDGCKQAGKAAKGS